MNYAGIVIGLGTFLIIGMFHPIVIKAEYYFGKRCWWVFLLAGAGAAAVALVIGAVPAECAESHPPVESNGRGVLLIDIDILHVQF